MDNHSIPNLASFGMWNHLAGTNKFVALQSSRLAKPSLPHFSTLSQGHVFMFKSKFAFFSGYESRNLPVWGLMRHIISITSMCIKVSALWSLYALEGQSVLVTTYSYIPIDKSNTPLQNQFSIRCKLNWKYHRNYRKSGWIQAKWRPRIRY